VAFSALGAVTLTFGILAWDKALGLAVIMRVTHAARQAEQRQQP